MSTSAFVILAAGRGTRMGRVGVNLHKALLPISQQAIISYLLDLRPPGAEVIVVTGHNAPQVREYLSLAHPGTPVTFVHAADYASPGAGPGSSLLAARDAVGNRDMVFTSCDTLWQRDMTIWQHPRSWAGSAPIPPGTAPERWCRLVTAGGLVGLVIDKKPADAPFTRAYTGLSRIIAADLPVFWNGIAAADTVSSERQVSGGLAALAQLGALDEQPVMWTDTGDADAYRHTIMLRDGYDWSKANEATWVLPTEGRVIKWWADEQSAERMQQRAHTVGHWMGDAEPKVHGQFLALKYIPGVIGYDAVKSPSDIAQFLRSPAVTHVMRPTGFRSVWLAKSAAQFYLSKTTSRISQLREELQPLARDIYQRIDWDAVTRNVIPAVWHGDMNLGNAIYSSDWGWCLIDWREDFAGLMHGDKRHDIAKLIGGLRIRWDWARRGDFTPWPDGRELEHAVREYFNPMPAGTDDIGILALLSSAPLHEPPLDEVILTRAAEWQGELS